MFFPKLLLLILATFSFANGQSSDNCKLGFDTNKYSVQNGDGGFILHIRDDNGKLVDRFQPSKEYHLIIQNYMIGTTFRDFKIQISPSGEIQKKKSLGKFSYPNYVQEDRNCPFTFVGKGKKQFSIVKMKWKAPQFPEKCIDIQVAIVMNPNLVYQDSHKLKKSLCASEMFSYRGDTPIVTDGLKTGFRKCCACGTASYLVSFRGLWNKTTHPRNWPEEKGQLHWTDPIGATHNYNYMIYHLGGQASQAVSRVCTMGDTRVLKDELMSIEERENVKSLFTSRWINGEEQINEERTGYVSVNQTHHLFSMISMMGPSPDWCTGISGIDLCSEGCKWKNNLTIPLYPWDAGIQSGETYKPTNLTRLINPEPIREINQSWMKDSPFTPNTPVAEIIITRVEPKLDSQCVQKPIKNVVEFHNMKKVSNPIGRGKNRGGGGNSLLDNPSLLQMSKFLCGFSQWTNWSPCSVPCGLGESTRKRELIKNEKNELCILLPRQETKDCEGQRRTCDYSDKCSLLPWSSWSICSATCTKPGKIIRTRQFAWDEEEENCKKALGSSVILVEEKQCKLKDSDSRCNPIDICSAGKVVRCINRKSSIRFYYHVKTGKCESFKYYGCKGSLNNFKSLHDCENTCSVIMSQLPEIRKTGLIILQSGTSYSEEKVSSKKLKAIPSQCFLQVNSNDDCKEGLITPIWYYNHRLGKCRSVMGFGCFGNFNKFPTYSQCTKTCFPNSPQNQITNDRIDCKVSGWSHWGPCSSKCGPGKQFRNRSIHKDSINGGIPCPALYESRYCFDRSC